MCIPDPIELMESRIERCIDAYEEGVCQGCGAQVGEDRLSCASITGDGPALCPECSGAHPLPPGGFTATFDNPSNLTRECYLDGELVYHVQLLALQAPPPPGRLFFGANVGPFAPGRLLGSPLALPPDLRHLVRS